MQCLVRGEGSSEMHLSTTYVGNWPPRLSTFFYKFLIFFVQAIYIREASVSPYLRMTAVATRECKRALHGW